jgi:hypothetical protein
MLRAQWPLSRGRPVIEVALILAQGGQQITRRLIADTGVGSLHSAIELLLDEHDCLLCGGTPMKRVVLGGAYVGSYPVYALRISIRPSGSMRLYPSLVCPHRQPALTASHAFGS